MVDATYINNCKQAAQQKLPEARLQTENLVHHQLIITMASNKNNRDRLVLFYNTLAKSLVGRKYVGMNRKENGDQNTLVAKDYRLPGQNIGRVGFDLYYKPGSALMLEITVYQ